MIIQSPKMLAFKEARARRDVGHHLLVGVVCKEGFVFGKALTLRSEELPDQKEIGPPEWLDVLGERVVMAMIGDVGAMRTLQNSLVNAKEQLSVILSTDRYVTRKFTEKVAHTVLRKNFQELAAALGVHLIVAELGESSFTVFDFTGKLKHFTYFVVAGCVDGDKSKLAREKAIGMLNDFCSGSRPKRWKIDTTISRVTKVLDECDPAGESDIIDIVVVSPRGIERQLFRMAK